MTALFRFKVEQKIDLRNTLQELGIKSIFTKDADLSAMTGTTRLCGKTLHTHTHGAKHLIIRHKPTYHDMKQIGRGSG